MNKYLKITRSRLFSSYLHKLELYSMRKGFDTCDIDSLRWKRLDLCIDSIERYIMDNLAMYGVRM